MPVFGPFDVIYDDEAVIEYMDSDPTDDEKKCMDRFIESIQRTGADVPHRPLTPDFVLVEACGFLIDAQYHHSSEGMIVIRRIRRPGIDRFRMV